MIGELDRAQRRIFWRDVRTMTAWAVPRLVLVAIVLFIFGSALFGCAGASPGAIHRVQVVGDLLEANARDVETKGATAMTGEDLIREQRATVRFVREIEQTLIEDQGFGAWLAGVIGGCQRRTGEGGGK